MRPNELSCACAYAVIRPRNVAYREFFNRIKFRVKYISILYTTLEGVSEEYNIIHAESDVSSRCESLKGMSERSKLIPCT